MKTTESWTLDRIIRSLLLLAGVAGLIWLAAYLSDALIPFGIAFLAAYVLNPAVNWVQTKVQKRSLAVAIVLAAVVAIGGLGLWILIPSIQGEASRTTALISRTISDSRLSSQVEKWLPQGLWYTIRVQLQQVQWLEVLQDQDAWKMAGTTLSKLLPGAYSLLSGTFSALMWMLGLTIILLYLVFLLLDFDHFINEIRGLVPSNIHGEVHEFVQLFDQAMSQYFRAQSLVALSVGILFSIGFSLIDLPLAILFGLFVGFLNMVPYLQVASIPIALLLGIIHAFDAGSSMPTMLLLILFVYSVVQIIQDAFLVPRIMGNITGLSPVMILLSLSVWGKLLGFFGLMVAIPFTCLVLAYYRKMLKAKQLNADTRSQETIVS